MNDTWPHKKVVLTLAALLLWIIPAPVGASIAKIAKVSGEVVLRAGGEVTQLTAPGARLNDGDQVQVRQGEAEILFDDGALLRVNAFSNALLQERQEEGGFWPFKTKVAVRRITCMVGKLFFQSGTPGQKNYLQTPTAVAGIRGSSGDIGFDNLNSYIHMYVGQAQVIGAMIQGLFQNPGANAAQLNSVYQALGRAAEQTRQAAASGRVLEVEQAKVAALQVVTRVADLLQNNPDPVVRTDALLARAASGAAIGAAVARTAVAQIGEDQARAEAAAAEARQKGEAVGVLQAVEAAVKAGQNLLAAEQAAQQAAAAAQQATAAADQRDVAAAQQAAQQAAAAAQQARNAAQATRSQIQSVAPSTAPTTTTAPPTTAEPTAPSTTVPTTAPSTSVPTTSTTTTSSTSTTSSTTTSSSTTSVAPSH